MRYQMTASFCSRDSYCEQAVASFIWNEACATVLRHFLVAFRDLKSLAECLAALLGVPGTRMHGRVEEVPLRVAC